MTDVWSGLIGQAETVGVLRSAASLADTAGVLAELSAARDSPRLATWEAANLLTVASALVDAATRREETRGCHWRDDFPEAQPQWLGHLLPGLDPAGAVTSGWEAL